MNSRFAAIQCGVWIMVIGTLSGALAAQQVDVSMVQTPNAQEVFATLRKEHPRVLATKESFDALRERVRTDARSKLWYGKLRTQAEKLLDQPPVKYELPDGMRLLSVSREVVHRTELLGLVWQVGHEDRFADRLWRELQTVAKFDDWHPPHFLDTAEMTFAVGVGYDWLYEHWTPEQRKVLEEAIVKNGLTPAMEAYSKNAWWTNCHHNWNQVCNGGIGVGALAIADQEPKLCGEILQNAVKNLPLAMVNYAPDGAWGEGPGYWGYATQYNVAILAALDSALGKDFGLSKIPGFSLAGDMPIYSNTPTGGSFNFADAPDDAIASSTMFWLAGKFDAPRFARERLGQLEGAAGGAGGKGAFSAEPLDLLWFNPKWADVSVTPAPLARYFPHVEMMTARSAWGDRKAAFLGFKAGSNAVNHSHLDVGSFIYETRGQRFFIDLGPDDYNLPDYFGKARWDYYRLRAEGHNTLVINPDGRPDQDPKAETKITRFDARSAAGKGVGTDRGDGDRGSDTGVCGSRSEAGCAHGEVGEERRGDGDG